ncbi:MAG: hypothetical protein ABIZ36_11065 [Gemmatimonadaceae bacterium]
MTRTQLVTLIAATLVIQACSRDGAGIIDPPPGNTGNYSLSGPGTFSVLQGGGGESKISIVRAGGFTGAVALAVTGMPPGIAARIEPAITSGTTAILVVATETGVATGSVTVTITGTAAGHADQTTTATVAIAPDIGGTGNVTVDFSTCGNKPLWFAFQDGTGAWTQILGSAGVYRFNIASIKGGYAAASQFETNISFATQAELTATPITPCGLTLPATKTVSGTVAGLDLNDGASVGMGGFVDSEAAPVTTSFILTGIQDGNRDLIAYRSNSAAIGTNERVVIRRDQDIPNNGKLDNIDFKAAESFGAATAKVTVTEAGPAPVSHFMGYYSGAGCSYYNLYDHPRSGVDFTMRGIPGDKQRSTDFHEIAVYGSDGISSRYVSESFHTLANRNIPLPAALPAPSVTAPLGGHKRIRAALTLPPEYQSSLTLLFFEQAGTRAWITASFGWLGGATLSLTSPDFSGVTGWRTFFLPASDAKVRWYLSAAGANSAAANGPCAENARFVGASVNGAAPI